jgi:nitrogen fixation protein NifB
LGKGIPLKGNKLGAVCLSLFSLVIGGSNMQCDCNKILDNSILPEELREKTSKHPCYSFEAHHKYARMHLPVAPACNISCNYCNRRFDCINESRPGVTSEILTPEMARDKFLKVKEDIPDLSVVGIAGPGDALANWDEVKKTILLIREISDKVMFCLSTNGLMLLKYADEIVSLGIKHVTVTVNSLDSSIGAQIYHHIVYDGKYYSGEAAAEILIKNQLEGIKYLADNGILVKVNIVMINDINSSHILEVVKKVKRLGAFMTNIMPLIPAPGSAFKDYPQTSMKDINMMRNICGNDIIQMNHCQQCRADAIGLLMDDQSYKYRTKQQGHIDVTVQKPEELKKYRVAVTSKYRSLVDLHYGHAEEFHIYDISNSNSTYMETRKVEKYCTGLDCDNAEDRKEAALKVIEDCDAVLTMRIGYDAQKRLADKGFFIVESCESVEEGLLNVLRKLNLKKQFENKVLIC